MSSSTVIKTIRKQEYEIRCAYTGKDEAFANALFNRLNRALRKSQDTDHHLIADGHSPYVYAQIAYAVVKAPNDALFPPHNASDEVLLSSFDSWLEQPASFLNEVEAAVAEVKLESESAEFASLPGETATQKKPG